MKMGNDLISARLVRANKIALGQGWHFSEYQENCRMASRAILFALTSLADMRLFPIFIVIVC